MPRAARGPRATASSSPSSARASRTTGSAPRTGLLDQLAVLCGERRPRAADRLPRPRRSSRCRSSSATGGSSRSTPAPRTSTRAAATTSAARSAPRPARRSASTACATRPARRRRCPSPLDRRVRHVLTENARVDATATRSRPATSHARRRACSTPPTRACATTTRRPSPRSRRRSSALKDAGAAGARMVGGGFGGSVLALFPPGATPPAGVRRPSPPGPPPAGSDSASASSSPSGRANAQARKSAPTSEHRQPGPEVHVDRRPPCSTSASEAPIPSTNRITP